MIAALLAPGWTRRILLSDVALFSAPYVIEVEVARHAETLGRRMGVDDAGFRLALRPLLESVVLVPPDELEAHLDEARLLLAHVDPDDVPYLACALAVDADAIWSHDPHFDAQDLVARVTNADLLPLL